MPGAFDSAVDLLTCFGTVGAALAAWLTVREMVRQRQSAYRPLLTFKGPEFEIADGAHLGFKDMPIVWRDNKHNDFGYHRELCSDPYIDLALVNVGLGTAKDLQAHFKYDVAKFCEKISRTKDGVFEVALEVGAQRAQVRLNGIEEIVDLEADWSHDYLMPLDKKADSTRVPLPYSYLLLCAMVWYVPPGTDQDAFEWDVPPLTVTISYLDIGGAKQSQTFSITPKLKGREVGRVRLEGGVEASETTTARNRSRLR